MSTPDPDLRLKSLRGATPPPDLRADLGLFARLPEAARARFWEALGPSLGEPIPSAVEGLLDGFCAATRADAGLLSRVLKAARFLVREAARRNVAPTDFTADLEALLPSDARSVASLGAGYERARALVRRELAELAILQHGKLLVGVDWRIDTIGTSNGAAELRQPVVMLTLTYREGERTERVTVQALPDTIAALGEMARGVLG